MVDNREHPAKEEQVARLQGLYVSAKRRRGGRELNAKVLQPALCTVRLRTFRAYHWSHACTAVHVQHLPGRMTIAATQKGLDDGYSDAVRGTS